MTETVRYKALARYSRGWVDIRGVVGSSFTPFHLLLPGIRVLQGQGFSAEEAMNIAELQTDTVIDPADRAAFLSEEEKRNGHKVDQTQARLPEGV